MSELSSVGGQKSIDWENENTELINIKGNNSKLKKRRKRHLETGTKEGDPELK